MACYLSKISSFLLVYLISGLSLMVNAQEIALQLYSLRNQMKIDVERYHEIINQWGIRYIEGGGTYGMSDQDYQDLLHRNGLKMVSIGGSFEEMRDNPKAVIERAKAFGAKYIVTFWVPHASGKFGMDDAKNAVEVFNAAGKLVKDAGLTFCYHPHGYEFKPHGDGTLFDYMIQSARDFDFQMDIFWVKMGGGDPLGLLRKHPAKFPLLHMKDRKSGTAGTTDGTGDVETNVVLGTGDIDIAGIIRQAKMNGVEYLIIEDESSRSVSQIPQSVRYINQILKE
ncbi:sugar phosphate isomerase/epimerase family protein [Lunatimonas salinarum]|uniref:sugar phosphate isomerase/epimerase family protein n=1 Tax=Lunatimonas salinarum TaxID=1774590 RepID=UPI001ADEE031|nr:sugar phosphate isomerase/epimerase [Lunatimonas salinarum]